MGLEGPSSVDRSRGAGIQAPMRPLTQLPLLSPCTEGPAGLRSSTAQADPLGPDSGPPCRDQQSRLS